MTAHQGRTSIPPPPQVSPRRTVATRILASFAFTLLAFAVTVGFSATSQKRTAEDSEELAKGYVPVALKLGQLRAVQSATMALVDNMPEEQRNSLSLKVVLETLSKVRRQKIEDTRASIQTLRELATEDATRSLARSLESELEVVQASFEKERPELEHLFAAFERGEKDAVNADIITVGGVEHDSSKRLKVLGDRVDQAMIDMSAAARARERRAISLLALLAALTLAVGLGVSVHTRRLLLPLERVTQRAKAVARGDLTPQQVTFGDDEIGQLAEAFERMVGAVGRAQSRAVANERLAAIGKMAAHVTHEIRNPLSSIGLNIEMLEEEIAASGENKEVKSLLAAISREVQRLEHLSEEYLRVARLPQPRMEADDVAATVNDLVSFARPEMERANLEVVLDVEADLPPALFDEGQIRQALLNILRNAREAMTDGGRIDVAVKAEGMAVVVRIDDRGSGIPEDVRARIFDPFFSTKGEGTGLGLAITRQIVEAHGGTISCDPREGGGTSFRVALPIAPPRNSGAMSTRTPAVSG